MIWYVSHGEREIGPLGEDALRALVGTGQITPDTRLWHEGLADWTAAVALPGVLGPRGGATLAPDSRRAISAAPNSSEPAAAPSRARSSLREPATPWRRYWARSIDISVSLFLVVVMIGGMRPGLFTQLHASLGQEEWAVMLVLLPFALLMDTLVYWALGNTPGKAIAGIKVLAKDGSRRLGAPAYLGRNFGMYVFGLALGLPVVSLFTLIYGYRGAAAGDLSIWDRFSGSRVYALSDAAARTWVAAGVYLLGLTAVVSLGRHQQHEESRYTAAHTPAPILQEELTQAANGVNASVPRMIDKITRLDGAHTGPGPLFTYEYTLTNLRLDQLSPRRLETLRWRLSTHVRDAICHGTSLAPMLSLGTTIRFHYRDTDGRNLVLVSVSSADCGR